jgi:uncharacterized repeat protein (TIGR03803 family)
MQRTFSMCLALFASLAFAPASLRAQAGPTFNLLYTFKAQGGSPGALVEVQPGRFFGIVGIAPGIFSVTSAGNYQDFYTFPTVQGNSIGVFGLTPALNGQLYGSASSFAAATLSELFSVAPSDKVTTYPYNPATQATPALPEIQSPYGLYGFFFNSNTSSLTFDRLDYKGNTTVLYTFPKTNGYISGLPFLGFDGAFYGIMLTNNTADAGIFRLTASGAFSWFVPSFATGGVYNGIGLMQARNGNFYGTLPSGGSASAGSIYEVTPSGQMTTIYQFPKQIFGIPEALFEASDGMIYGTARGLWGGGYTGYSSIFQLNPYTGQVKTVYSFPNGGVTGECDCSIVQGSDGKFYGAASGEGTYQLGTLFSLDLGLSPPKPHIGLIEPSSEAPGKWVLLWGASLLGTTAVSFNGTPASSFAVASSQGVLAEVPNGATSGPITITTPNGSFTTTKSFTVE